MMKTQELTTLGSTLVILGIVFSSDRLIGYSFIGAGMLFSLLSLAIMIRAKKEGKGKNLAGRGS
jgi:hypothetical protein